MMKRGLAKMSPEAKAREEIDKKLVTSGWIIQDMKRLNLTGSAVSY